MYSKKQSGYKAADKSGGENSYNKKSHNGSFKFKTVVCSKGYKAGK